MWLVFVQLHQADEVVIDVIKQDKLIDLAHTSFWLSQAKNKPNIITTKKYTDSTKNTNMALTSHGAVKHNAFHFFITIVFVDPNKLISKTGH